MSGQDGSNGGRRRALTIAVWALAAAVALATVVRLTGFEPVALVAQVLSFTPYLAIGGLLVTVVAAVSRRFVAAGLAGLATIVLVACVVPRAVDDADAGEPTDGVPLVVMSVNLRLGLADPAAVVSLVEQEHVDVLALQEFSPDAERGLLAAGLAGQLPYRESYPLWGAGGSGLFARVPLTDGGVRTVSAEGHGQTYGTLVQPGAVPVTVESVHTVPPLDAYLLPFWRTALGNEIPARSPGPPRILIGDFNATLDHPELRRLLATGYRDAADEVGAGLVPTWPFYGERSLVTPKITLDHVLLPAGVGVRSLRAATVPRTDHRAVIATLLLPASG